MYQHPYLIYTFSAFLMICFMNIGHAQRVLGTTIPNVYNPNMQIENVSSVHNLPAGPQYVRVRYDVGTLQSNSVTYIIDESDGSMLFTTNLSLGQSSISVFVEPNNAATGGAIISCYVSNEGTGDFARLACIGSVDGQGPGGEW